MHASSPTTRRRRRGLAATAAAGAALLAGAAAAPAATASTAASPALTARVIFSGAAAGITHPDDAARIGDRLFVAFQNSVPSTGGTPGAPAGPTTQSTVVELTMSGRLVTRWQLTGKCDGLAADPAHNRLIATVNEDGNSSVYTIGLAGGITHLSYNADPLPHGGGTDAVSVVNGTIYTSGSAPTVLGPALYRVALSGRTARLVSTPFFDSSVGMWANTGQTGTRVTLALTDPDSTIAVPMVAPRFGGDFMVNSQGDQQQIYVSDIGTPAQRLRVLALSQSVDDTAWATTTTGSLVVTDSTNDTVDLVTGAFTVGRTYAGVTPADSNTPPPNPPANYLGTIALSTGMVSPLAVGGVSVVPAGLLFVPGSQK